MNFSDRPKISSAFYFLYSFLPNIYLKYISSTSQDHHYDPYNYINYFRWQPESIYYIFMKYISFSAFIAN